MQTRSHCMSRLSTELQPAPPAIFSHSFILPPLYFSKTMGLSVLPGQPILPCMCLWLGKWHDALVSFGRGYWFKQMLFHPKRAADFMIFFLNKRTAIVCCYLELFGRYCAHTTLYKHSMTLLLITTPVTNDRNLSQ